MNNKYKFAKPELIQMVIPDYQSNKDYAGHAGILSDAKFPTFNYHTLIAATS